MERNAYTEDNRLGDIGPSYTIQDYYRSVVVFISYWASSYTTSDIHRFDNHCESHSTLEVVYNAPIAIRYSVTGAYIQIVT